MESFIKVETIGLPVGDYGCMVKGEHCPVIFERKSMGDLFGTMTQGYNRFKKMLAKAKELKVKVILLIEKPYHEVLEGYEHSQFKGESMLKKLATLHVRYDLDITVLIVGLRWLGI